MNLLTIFNNRKKILGMNRRNLNYIRPYNKARAKAIADDKLLTKTVLTKHGIATPKLLSVINNYKELNNFDWNSLPSSFVMKPVSGLEGNGIDIFYNRNEQGQWIRADKSKADVDELHQLASDILSGRFSLHQEQDRVMFEERIKIHKRFRYYTYKGTPDIRIIIFNHIPIMSYIRIPTKESQGKANLALGAIGAGIDMARGVTTFAIHGKSGKIDFIPDTKLRVSGLQIPYWNKILELAIQAQQATNLNFAAVDFLIDKEQGPFIVELNARPGLSIQLANEDGLHWRLRKAQGIKVKSVEKGVRLAKDLFGGEIEESIEILSGKDVVGIYENIELYDAKMQPYPAKAKIDTGADSTSIDKKIAQNLGFQEIVKLIDELPHDIPTREAGLEMEEKLRAELFPKYPQLADLHLVKSSHGMSVRLYVTITIKIQDTVFETKASIFDRSKLTYPVIIGRKSLNKFLVDPSKTK